MSRNILDSAAGGAFMSKTIVEAKNILESILQNYSQWHTDRAPNPSKKINSVEETNDLSSKMDTILALLNKPNIENVPLQELVGNNPENIDVNFIRNYGNNGFGSNNITPIINLHMFPTTILLFLILMLVITEGSICHQVMIILRLIKFLWNKLLVIIP